MLLCMTAWHTQCEMTYLGSRYKITNNSGINTNRMTGRHKPSKYARQNNENKTV